MSRVFDGAVFDSGVFDVGEDHALSDTLRTLLASGWADLVEVCEVDFPDGTMRFAPVPYTSIERGHFDAKVRTFGPVAIVSSDRAGNLGGNETTMEFDDTDRAVARRVEGAQANNVVGSAVRRYLAAPSVPFSDWFLIFEGVITKEPEYMSEFVGTLTARTNDAALGQKTPRQPWTIDQISWPNAHSSALNKPAALVYGSHAASNFQTGPGFIPGLCVDTVGLRWSLAAGRLKSVSALYVDDVTVVTGWSSSYRADRRGRIHTIVTLDAATLLADYGITVDVDSTVVTADVEGYSDGPYGTGSLIEAPADILSHLLSNFVLGDWKNQSTWLSTHSLIGTSLTSSSGVVKSFLANRQAEASPSYLTWTTGYQIIADFCDQHGLRAYWLGGKLEFAVEDVAVPPYSGQLLDGDRDVSSMTIAVDDIKMSPAVRVSHVHSASQEKELMSFLVTLPELSQDETDELVLLWSPAS